MIACFYILQCLFWISRLKMFMRFVCVVAIAEPEPSAATIGIIAGIVCTVVILIVFIVGFILVRCVVSN